MKRLNRVCIDPLMLCFVFICMAAPAYALEPSDQTEYLAQINLSTRLEAPLNRKIVVAIVDDGVRTSHHELREFLWQNPFEIAGNLIDDDGNGYVDDVNGWDVADDNNQVAPPIDRLEQYYHGTHLAGIITRIARATYGEKAPQAVAIMPVKSLSDDAPNTAIRHGYRGVEYAVKTGADIILCAWNVGHISSDEERILRKAKEKGILVIASAGNFPDEREQYPAADESVFAVAALDADSNIAKKSNYGTFVDLSAPGMKIVSASALSDSAQEAHEGTSQAAAIVAGAAAVMKALNPTTSNAQLKACLKNGASPLSVDSKEHNAKHGAGQLNVNASVDCINEAAIGSTTRDKPQGYLDLTMAETGVTTWSIEPPGNFKGLWFSKPDQQIKSEQIYIDFYKGSKVSAEPFARFPLNTMPDKFFVPGTSAVVKVKADKDSLDSKPLLMEYRAEAIKYRTLYCRDTVYINEPGSFGDGSSDSPYSANSDCKWLITAPKGKVVHFRFNEFDTEPKTDFLYFFNGSGTHEQIMAKFSGPDIPPQLTSWRNKVLVWFVTNGENQGQGWQGEISFIDKNIAFPPR